MKANLLLCIPLLLAVGCERGDTTKTVETGEASAASGDIEPAAALSPKEAARVARQTAKDFLKGATGKDVELKNGKVHTEETDPNKLLGRPGQYLAKVNWTERGGEATIEVYPDAESAKKRAEYVETIGKNSPMLLQYVYVHPTRHAVLRLPKELTPKQAEVWRKILMGI